MTATRTAAGATATILAALFPLAACAEGTGDDGSTAGGGAGGPSAFDPDTELSGELGIMGFGGEDEIGQTRLGAAQDTIAPVEVSQVKGDLDIQQFLSAVAAGEPPDIVYANRDQIGTFASRGAIIPLDDCIDGGDIDLSVFREPALGQVTFDGSVYGIPEFNQVQIVMANTDLLEGAGLTLDDVDGSDWSAIESAATAMAGMDADPPVIGYDSKLPEFLPLWAKANGADLLSDDARTAQIDTPEVAEALEFAVGVYDSQGGFGNVKAVRDSADFFGVGNQFATGVLGAMPMEHWYVNVLNDASPNVPMTFGPVRGLDGEPLAYATGSAWAIPDGSGNPEAACRFAKTMTLTDSWLAAAQARVDAREADGKFFTGLLTGNVEADEAIREQFVVETGDEVWDAAIAAMYEANDNTFTLPANPADAEFKTAWQDAVNRVLNGQQDVDAALEQAQQEAQAALDSAWDEWSDREE